MNLNFALLLLLTFAACQWKNGEKTIENHSELTAKIDSIIQHSDFNGVVLEKWARALFIIKLLGIQIWDKKQYLNQMINL